MRILFENCRILGVEQFDDGRTGFVSVCDDRIEFIGTEKPLGTFDRTIACDGNLLTPAFYNAHCHSAMTLFRGYGEDLPLSRWLNEKIFPAEEKLTHESIRVGSSLAIAEMIEGGTVSFSDMYEKCEDTAEVVLSAGMKANLSRAVLSFTDDDPRENSRAKEGIELFRNYNNAGNGRLKVDLSLHAEYTNKEPTIRYLSERAKELGAHLHIHLSETESEHQECKERHNGMTPTAFFASCGAFDVPTLCAHGVYLTDEDYRILAAHGATVAHNPTSNLKLGSGIMRLRNALEAGVNVALGTDGVSSNNNLDMLFELRLASILHKGVNRQADHTSAKEMFSLIAKNGAKAQGRTDCGEIKIGNKADLVLIDMDRCSNIPCYDIYASFAYSIHSSDVILTMCDGNILYENGEFKTIDIERIKAEFKQVLAHYFD